MNTPNKYKILKEIIEVDKQDSEGYSKGDDGDKKVRAQGYKLDSSSKKRRSKRLRYKKLN